MTHGEALARQIEAECYDLAALNTELQPKPQEPDMPHPSAGQFALKRNKGRKTQTTFGNRNPMDLSPPDKSYDAHIAWWNNTVAPWARGERA
jgi:hypothetical protein